ncbi:MAG: MdtA/MuxA family multidrug efflux RND transporter periplasmic adaptor subunit [Deltaproteobacteria bacterium]|nr:MdtA/MuxA family multidrug efflux RND transporter periplasmic adaptor subunit [Deltaproteobacteria bacterium]
METTLAAAPARRRAWMWVIGAAIAAVAAYRLAASTGDGAPEAPPGAAKPAAPPVPVVAVAARRGDMPVYLSALGTVTAYNTVTVKSRVDGQIVRVAFEEGQAVREGDLLVEIDPRPFQVQLAQAEGQMARDRALLAVAKRTLQRNRELLDQGIIARQMYDDQQATVGQYEGAVQVDQALIDQAKLQLTYSRVTAPIGGRVGLRRVDVGNVVRASDEQGLCVITQVQPITVLFSVPEDDLRAVLDKAGDGRALVVEAYDRAGQKELAAGTLQSTDNQIDPATGTARLKAVFDNADRALFPNQFVNVRLRLDVRENVVIVPGAAVQRGAAGTFVYVVTPDATVEVRPVVAGPEADGETAIASGLAAAERVVVDGVDKLRAGSAVKLRGAEAAGPARTPASAQAPPA